MAGETDKNCLLLDQTGDTETDLCEQEDLNRIQAVLVRPS